MLLYKPWRRRIDRKRQVGQQARQPEACEEGGFALGAQFSSEKEKVTVAECNVKDPSIGSTDPSRPPVDQIHMLDSGTART